MPLTPSALTPQLRRAGYFIAFLTIFILVAEVLLRAWPFRLGSSAWRLGIASSVSSIVPTLLLMAFVLIAMAIFAGSRRLSITFSGLAFFAAICFLALFGAFVLDTLELRNQVRVSATRQYDITAAWTLIRVLVGLVGFVMLGVASLRSAIAARQQTARQTQKGGTLIAGSTPTPGPRVGEPAGLKK